MSNFFEVFVDILHLGSGAVDSHIFADPDPGSQNLADPTDPDPKHCFKSSYSLWVALYYKFLTILSGSNFQAIEL